MPNDLPQMERAARQQLDRLSRGLLRRAGVKPKLCGKNLSCLSGPPHLLLCPCRLRLRQSDFSAGSGCGADVVTTRVGVQL